MSRNLQRGEKAKLADLDVGSRLEVDLTCQTEGPAPNLCCFGVDENGKLSDVRYFIFQRQTASPENAVVQTGPAGGRSCLFQIDLDRLPPTVSRLVFAAALENASFQTLRDGRMDLVAPAGVAARFAFSRADFADEKAIIIGEIYRKTVWRLAAVGQGFAGGLPALLKHFGREDIDPAAIKPPPPPALQAPAAPPVNLSKVRLDKQGDAHRVDLAKRGEGQIIHANLQWDQPRPAKPSLLASLFGGGGRSGADLDLGCMWRDKSGHRGVIQPLGGDFGSKNNPPYISLDKDDRSGAARDGENMRFFKPETISLVVVFAMIYEGTGNFTDVNARLTLYDGRGGEILIPLDAPDPERTFCAVAKITDDQDGIKVQKEERYFASHPECDKHYGFGFKWVEGKK